MMREKKEINRTKNEEAKRRVYCSVITQHILDKNFRVAWKQKNRFDLMLINIYYITIYIANKL